MAKAPEQLSVEVPTMDDFNALQAQVNNHETRITALEHGSTSGASPDGTTATDPSVTITDGDGRKFKLTGPSNNYKIDCDGNVTGGSVIRLYAKNRMCYQENVNHDWWYAPLGTGPINSGDDWTFTTNPTGGNNPSGDDVAPDYAQALGYTEMTLGPDVTLNKNWWPYDGANLTQNADGSVTDHGGVPNHYNAHASTTHRGPNGEIRGKAFKHGFYAEIEWSWKNPPSAGYQNTDGWPSWWATTAEADNRYNVPRLPNDGNLEFDCCEYMNTSDNTEFNNGIIHWYGGQGAKYSNADAGLSGSARSPAGTDVTQKHKIGWVWVEATDASDGYIESYFDRKKVGNRYSWKKWGGGGVPGQLNCAPFSIQDAGSCQLIFGTGTKNELTVYKVRVWQKPGTVNVGG